MTRYDFSHFSGFILIINITILLVVHDMLVDSNVPVCFHQSQGLLVESVGGAQRAGMHSCECACVYMSALISPHEMR